DNVSVICGDIMKTDLHALVDEYLSDCDEIAVCANLPYYITTPIIMLLLESGIPFSSITIMIQKEVADRLTAAPGTPDYGSITASCAYYGKARKLFAVPAGNFTPPPKVDSAVVGIKLYGENKPVAPKDEKTLFSVIGAAFAQRRKTLSNALNAAMPDIGKDVISDILVNCGFDPAVRGEKLSVAQFSLIADAVYDFRINN
ncbi:MAG: 16S rRNA (adenine(1518)-N(6)/adenine(1519)-N(6))-dimethyltransferase, partial [Clostridia bacterium]|nr:16S rRNA (adenine(1518)-N(6)/adenine(1519)-N(6))-dimethyltransferase [Clostridia bacterium]